MSLLTERSRNVYTRRVNELKCFARSALLWNNRRVEVRFAELDGQLVCIGVEIGPKLSDEDVFINVKDGDLRPLAATEIRMPLRHLIDVGLQTAVMSRTGTGDFGRDTEAFRDDLGRLNRAQTEPRKRPGRPPSYGEEHFEEVARVYRDHTRAGGRAPTKAVQQRFQPVTKSAAAKWVSRARQMGLIEPTEGADRAS